MSKEEFLNELRIALQGEVSQDVMNENIQYYDRYIMSEMRSGRSQENVMEELGNPRLIARTIIDTHANMKTVSNTSRRQTEYSEENRHEQQREFHAEYGNNGGWNFQFGRTRLNTWYGKLLFIICLIVFLTIIGIILNVLLPFILVGIVIWLITTLIKSTIK